MRWRMGLLRSALVVVVVIDVVVGTRFLALHWQSALVAVAAVLEDKCKWSAVHVTWSSVGCGHSLSLCSRGAHRGSHSRSLRSRARRQAHPLVVGDARGSGLHYRGGLPVAVIVAVVVVAVVHRQRSRGWRCT
ncbi:hypothetical protein EDB85DRAFT_1910783 [Lactarius pseudohatsudake]|nr:hypothetical protein EDB85DRAFT_1910783 [Lactarius pseudohatsudake]